MFSKNDVSVNTCLYEECLADDEEGEEREEERPLLVLQHRQPNFIFVFPSLYSGGIFRFSSHLK